MTQRLLGRLSIPARLLLLSVSLILVIAGSNLYLTQALRQSANKALAADRTVGELETVQGVRAAFDALRYWRADLAVSLLMLSQRNADAARLRLAGQLSELAMFDSAAAASLQQEATAFDRLATQAVDAYTDDHRIIGNTLFAQARVHSLQATEQLDRLEAGLAQRERVARDEVVQGEVTALRVSILVVMASLLFGIALTVLILRSILGPLGALVAAVRRISAGDVATAPPAPGGGELGELAQAVLLLRDGLVARALLERETQHQREVIHHAIESINEGFALVDAEQRLVLCNSYYQTLYAGGAATPAPGTGFPAMLRAAVARGVIAPGEARAEQWLAARMAGDTAAGLTPPVECRFGERWVRISERATAGGGTVAIYSDITELKARQIELERATQVKSEFLANMSHELRTPLNAIIGYSQLLMEDAEDTGATEVVADLRKIEMAGNHLLGLINSVLDLSKIEAGRMEALIELVDLPALVADVELMVAPLVARNTNRLVVDCAPALGSIRTDQAKLRQSLLNLLSNAAKFTQNGVIRLAVARDGADALRFTVTDSGIGLTEAQIGRLFQPFSQADASTTRRFGGTGLGLAITRSLIRLLGGDVTVISRPGEGATFSIVLPLQPELSAATEATSGGAGPTILVVDDDDAARAIIGAHLARDGYRLIFAASGAEAIAAARSHRPELITLDLLMPEVDGWSVLHRLKQEPALAGIPVVLISVSEQGSLGVELGAAHVLAKPVDRDQLLEVVRACCRDSPRGAVLVVDDDADMRDIAQRAVDRLGYQVAAAADGERAIAWLEANPLPVLILLDLLMPRMDGFAVLRRLRARPDWAHIPVVVITARQLDPAEERWLRDVASDVVAKGQSAYLTLSETVREVLGREAPQ